MLLSAGFSGRQQARWLVSQRPCSSTCRHAVVKSIQHTPGSATATQAPHEQHVDVYEELGRLAGVTSAGVSVQQTQLGRGLVAGSGADRQVLLSVPTNNSLIIADNPLDSISIFSDRHLASWQQQHGTMPEELVEFLQGDARWDVRMAAWLLWVAQHPSPLWEQYRRVLPASNEVSCLLTFGPEDILELQLPALQREASMQAAWAKYIHDKYLSSSTGDLRQLRLSSGLQQSLWAVAMVRSRTFSEDVGGEMLTLMVPYADLANHADDNNATFCLNRQSMRFELRALRPVAAGEEVAISYGECKPNCDLLRDYGFVVPGNMWDRVYPLGPAEGKHGATAAAAAPDQQPPLVHLNPVTLLEAAGFTGDLVQGSITPGPSLPTGHATRWQRRTAALLSLPVRSPACAAAHLPTEATHQLRGRQQVVQQQQRGATGVLSLLDELARPWTPLGQAQAVPLQQQEVPEEQAAVAALKQGVLQQLKSLPTSMQFDQALLGGAAAGLSGVSLSSGDDLDLPAATPLTVQQRVAVQARLEHKLLLKETLAVLMAYEQHLERCGS